MKKCYHCKRTGNQAEKFIGIPKLKDRSICFGCAVGIYLIIKQIVQKGSSITGKLDTPESLS